jgi:nitrogenase molybdenum-iron protein alpha/beta subunit
MKKREKYMANEQNLKPFQKGNPGGGRPKGSVSLVKLLEKLLDKKIDVTDPFAKKIIDPVTGKEIKPKVEKKVAEAVVLRLLMKALNGDMPAIKEVLERIDGKVNQTITGSKDGDPIMHEHDVKHRLVNSEIEDRINHLLKECSTT